ncbi:sortase A [Arcanobacterium pluranimalium]|uniref:class C sortase n=1 Tax=Arcanobacterium pluranimalium TaxID=108028 RepID=UPI0019586BEC|nr:sortase A [Arcanobacterium pluranimalium]
MAEQPTLLLSHLSFSSAALLESEVALRKIRRTRWKLNKFSLIPAFIALIGVVILLYPMAASWVSQVNQSALVHDYSRALDNAQPSKDQQIQLAHKYNEALRSGAIIESGANKAVGTGSNAGADSTASLKYEDMLHTPQSAVMARVKIDSIGVDLPIYHGTSDETLRVGVGHLKGTSLPVGGIGTRAVLTAHRGLAEATLFTNLDKVKKNDEIVIEVFGEVLDYRVVDIQIIDPDATQNIKADPNRDLISLITCTPLGINTQRILVTAERVTPTPPAVIEDQGKKPDIPGFPWWIVYLSVALSIITWYVWTSGTRQISIKPD